MSDQITVRDVCKDHGRARVLDQVSFTAEPGRVTAFLGQNGAGKSSTLRILMGLDRATSGSATFGGRRYRDLRPPLRHVGCVFDGVGGSRLRTVRTHLKLIAQSNGIRPSRIEEVLAIVGMGHKAKARIGSLSLGEGQRLGLAVALLGDPQFLVLDEPTNGLDPGGILWIRRFLTDQAAQGRTVLLSSHMLHEVEEMADDLVIIDKGRVVLSGDLESARRRLDSLEDVFFSVTQGS